jgi:hypothetical protein
MEWIFVKTAARIGNFKISFVETGLQFRTCEIYKQDGAKVN